MEFGDVYNENRELMGYTHDRSQPLREGEFLLAVGVWVFNSRKEILLTKRSPEKRFAPNLWDEYVLYRDVAIEEIRLQEGETCEARWVSEEEFERMVAAGEVVQSVGRAWNPRRGPSL